MLGMGNDGIDGDDDDGGGCCADNDVLILRGFVEGLEASKLGIGTIDKTGKC